MCLQDSTPCGAYPDSLKDAAVMQGAGVSEYERTYLGGQKRDLPQLRALSKKFLTLRDILTEDVRVLTLLRVEQRKEKHL
jgi:hypothetical protein